MIRIERSDWLQNTFAYALVFTDLSRFPIQEVTNELRQSQIIEKEVVRVLGHHENYSLVMKYDGTLGWVQRAQIQISTDARELSPPEVSRLDPLAFLNAWLGTPYLWGGITKQGIDCSGFTQKYYWEVLGTLLPKNSRDQRKLGVSKSFSEIDDHDLVFCHRKNGSGIHHVALFFESSLWHARLEHGVVRQSVEEFTALYELEEVVNISL